MPALVLAFVAGGAWLALRTSRAVVDAHVSARARRVVPDSVRIKVEVLNATDARGLARRAMTSLRDAGFDVVYFGNTAERVDTSVVRVRSGHGDWAALAVKALGVAHVEPMPDSSHFLDLTILVGRSWAPSREPFRP